MLELQYYNFGHFLMMLLVPIVFFSVYLPLKDKSNKTQEKVLMWLFAANGAVFITYKIFMYMTYDSFLVLNELPLHLCNLNVILLPLTLKLKNKVLFNYLYYIGTIAALAAVTLFDTLFLARPIYDYGVFIYFLYHSVLLAGGILFPMLKFFSPSLKGIVMSTGTLLCLATLMHIVNSILRMSGACEVANYFYTYGMEGNPLLGMLMKAIPIPILYMLPILPVLFVVNLLMFYPFYRMQRALQEQNKCKAYR